MTIKCLFFGVIVATCTLFSVRRMVGSSPKTKQKQNKKLTKIKKTNIRTQSMFLPTRQGMLYLN